MPSQEPSKRPDRGPKPNPVTDVPEPSNVRPPGEPTPERRPPVKSADDEA